MRGAAIQKSVSVAGVCDVVICGGGPAGFTAARLRAQGFDRPIDRRAQ